MHVSYAAQTCHSSDYVTPQCSFTEPVIHCTRKIDAILKVGSADKAPFRCECANGCNERSFVRNRPKIAKLPSSKSP